MWVSYREVSDVRFKMHQYAFGGLTVPGSAERVYTLQRFQNSSSRIKGADKDGGNGNDMER